MSQYQVVTDIAEIARLNKRLGEYLRKIFGHRETRRITYPAGNHKGTVYFEEPSGEAVRAWSPQKGDTKLCNYILSGSPGSSHWMEISVQLNFPAGKYNRRRAGAFVVDDQGDIFIAHRGRLTRGHAALEKRRVFREFAAQTIEAQDNKQTSKLILISALDDPALADRLWEFGEMAREVATRLAAENDTSESDPDMGASGSRASGKNGKRKSGTREERMLKLRAYFDEYAGEGSHAGHGGGKRTVEHGDVVKALEAQLRTAGMSQKAQAIDLAIVGDAHVDLYEVKTSASTTDVYTGVGQLLIHGECLADVLDLPVKRHLVLPAEPKRLHRKPITGKAGIRVVLYEKKGAVYRFSGLGSDSKV